MYSVALEALVIPAVMTWDDLLSQHAINNTWGFSCLWRINEYKDLYDVAYT